MACQLNNESEKWQHLQRGKSKMALWYLLHLLVSYLALHISLISTLRGAANQAADNNESFVLAASLIDSGWADVGRNSAMGGMAK